MAYLAMLYLGLTSGIIVSNYFANLAGLDSARIFIATVLLTIPFLVGARLLFVAINWKLFVASRRASGAGQKVAPLSSGA